VVEAGSWRYISGRAESKPIRPRRLK